MYNHFYFRAHLIYISYYMNIKVCFQMLSRTTCHELNIKKGTGRLNTSDMVVGRFIDFLEAFGTWDPQM